MNIVIDDELLKLFTISHSRDKSHTSEITWDGMNKVWDLWDVTYYDKRTFVRSFTDLVDAMKWVHGDEE